ncbi:boron transporter 4 [Bidens hawaiensis]|uniref:boron transporter 4 n=1 Tax=Bidens hawaiensis TaxID=980011 RepID=UPI00404AA3D7
MKYPFRGIAGDIRGRVSCYKQDWIAGITPGIRILAPTMYIFFASALPVIAFGEQLSRDSDGRLSTVETLASTAICGIIHSILGGQPLMIVGVAEPTIIMYTYLYEFAKGRQGLGPQLYLAWSGWVCVWTAILLFVMAIFNASDIISRFTRMAGETFGMLISVLFIQQAIKGLVSEFNIPKSENPDSVSYQLHWLYTNGLLAIIFSFGLLYTALKSKDARSWLYGTGWLRSFIADYGVPLMVVVWTALSFCVPNKVPSYVPRRLYSPLLWDYESLYHWTVIKDMGKVPLVYIMAAFIPGVMVAALYFFDHSVASQLAQQKEFNIKKPSAYHYDIFLLGFTTLLCGLIGLPPANGVLPQSPMHTKSLAVLQGQASLFFFIIYKEIIFSLHLLSQNQFITIELFNQFIKKKMMESVDESMEQKASVAEIYNKMRKVFIDIDNTPITSLVVGELKDLEDAIMNVEDGLKSTKEKFNLEKHIDAYLPVRVNEQRVSNFLQSILVAASICAMPVIKLIPTSVLWGYFAYMAIDSLPGNQFWERVLLLFVSPGQRYKFVEKVHTYFVETVPYRTIVIFTIFQVVYFLACFGVTWIPIGGILFPLMFFILIVIRQYILPKMTSLRHLNELDAAEFDEFEDGPSQPLLK